MVQNSVNSGPHHSLDEIRFESIKSNPTYEESSPLQDRFERTFELRGKGYDDDMVRFAQSAMSNMVGGIGYDFHN